MPWIKKYFRDQIEEIRGDTAVRIYGAFVAFGYLLCFRMWNLPHVAAHIADPAQIYCWPFFENCFATRYFTAEQVLLFIKVYGVLAFIGVPLFFFKRTVSWAYWWLIVVTLMKSLIYFQDYHLRMNQHYMLYFVTFALLFLPHKRQMLRIVMVMFYFWASTLKFNNEWISGEAMHTKPWLIPWRFYSASCVYAIIIEFLIVWGTLCANRIIFWFALSQLALFHIVSWSIVGWFYPTLMFALLTIFPLTVFMPVPDEPKSQFKSLFTGKQPVAVYAYIAFFSFLQLIPVMIPGDEKITDEGRLFSLHMIDARVKCEGEITLKFKDGSTREIAIPVENSIKRTECEPAKNFSVAKRTCYLNKDNPNFDDLDMYYVARKKTQKVMRPLVDIKDFCSQDLTYYMLWNNDWIIRHE